MVMGLTEAMKLAEAMELAEAMGPAEAMVYEARSELLVG